MRGFLPSRRHLSGLALHCRLTTAYFLLSLALPCPAAPPVVTNVRAVQRAGTKLVDVFYDLADADSSAVRVSLEVTNNGVPVPAVSLSGNGIGEGVAPGAGRSILWNAGADWDGQVSDKMRFRVIASDDPAMVLIPAGSFQMGNSGFTSRCGGFRGFLVAHEWHAAPPVLTNLRAETKLVDVFYDLTGADWSWVPAAEEKIPASKARRACLSRVSPYPPSPFISAMPTIAKTATLGALGLPAGDHLVRFHIEEDVISFEVADSQPLAGAPASTTHRQPTGFLKKWGSTARKIEDWADAWLTYIDEKHFQQSGA